MKMENERCRMQNARRIMIGRSNVDNSFRILVLFCFCSCKMATCVENDQHLSDIENAPCTYKSGLWEFYQFQNECDLIFIMGC